MIIAGFVFVILGMGFVITGLLAVVSGWHKLSRYFRDMSPPQNPQFIGESIGVGGVGYGRSVTICLAADGLHLKMSLTCRFMHPPLLIPWSEIASIAAKKILFTSFYELVISKTGTKMEFHGDLGESIQDAWQKRRNS